MFKLNIEIEFTQVIMINLNLCLYFSVLLISSTLKLCIDLSDKINFHYIVRISYYFNSYKLMIPN